MSEHPTDGVESAWLACHVRASYKPDEALILVPDAFTSEPPEFYVDACLVRPPPVAGLDIVGGRVLVTVLRRGEDRSIVEVSGEPVSFGPRIEVPTNRLAPTSDEAATSAERGDAVIGLPLSLDPAAPAAQKKGFIMADVRYEWRGKRRSNPPVVVVGLGDLVDDPFPDPATRRVGSEVADDDYAPEETTTSPSIDECLAALASAGYDTIEAEVRTASGLASVLVWRFYKRAEGCFFRGKTLGEALQRAVRELAPNDPRSPGSSPLERLR